ncbi:hypothetical protein [Streptomyces sp. 8L]|uniref:hypothetical protein n=1 Tax=Streptomyces sp. 8L TaxID=2877242 RepID=UPI001CD1BCBE|nr:hypothetical protein [Streptomyces sp. 8L]MCA1220685.1 hypothetical protein [Streptomyces sp. 8L]
MDDSTTLYGAASIVLGGLFAFLTALVGRPRDRPERPEGEPDAEQLTTVAGIAAVVAQQQQRLRDLETEQTQTTAQVGALTRYVRTLKAALRSAHVPVPEPDPGDRHLIDQ